VEQPRGTLAGFIREVAAAHPDADAVVLPGTRLSYAQMLAGASGWARRFIALGIGPGEHVGVLLPNGTNFMEVLFGIALAGAVAVPLNSRYRGPEIAATAADADLVTIVTTPAAEGHPSFSGRLREAFPDLAEQPNPRRLALAGAPRLRNVVALGEPVEPWLVGVGDLPVPADAAGELERRQAAVSRSDTGIILYTSGSTSRPKGCLLSHGALLAQGQLMAGRYEMTCADRIWSPVPMFHVGGISPFIAIASVGGAFLSMPRIEPGAGLALMSDERATISYVLFQTIITDLLQYHEFASFDLGAVRLMISNLALQPPWIAALLAERMPQAIQIGTFGLTETVGAACTHSPRDDADDRLRRLGRPLPGISVRIVGEDGSTVPVGGIGEVLLRGPTLCDGYYRDADKSRATLQDGWLRTGDRGSLDERGSIMFHGRIKDVLKVGGENVGALEVEAVVGDHPAVKGCAVVGMADARLVEVPVVFVELKPGMTATEHDIIGFCDGRLASFKVPRRAFFVTEWPMNSTKIDKPALRQYAAEIVGSERADATR
jgi:fatty-acyl-CoA synthase